MKEDISIIREFSTVLVVAAVCFSRRTVFFQRPLLWRQIWETMRRNLVWRLVSVCVDEKAQPVSAIARRGYQEMRIKDALKALIRKKERGSLIPMETVWTQQADDENQVPLPEYPRPQLKRASWLCLNGWWEYAFTGTREVPERPDGRILVPFSPETSRSGVGRTLHPESLQYRRRSLLSTMGRKKETLLLHFSAGRPLTVGGTYRLGTTGRIPAHT